MKQNCLPVQLGPESVIISLKTGPVIEKMYSALNWVLILGANSFVVPPSAEKLAKQQVNKIHILINCV